ncbi:sugar nucleotide-binding protein [Komagataeibacter rhaeticus]|nr:sugar nucleotide-binding protein [Komagataeibacter rhaeticus]
MLHVSTDHVFSGTRGRPYRETDPTDPQSVYGRSRAEGEKAVLAACARAMVVRTSWVYGPYGRNFVRTMLEAACRETQLQVVADQSGHPTAAPDLADALLQVAARIRQSGWQPAYRGCSMSRVAAVRRGMNWPVRQWRMRAGMATPRRPSCRS